MRALVDHGPGHQAWEEAQLPTIVDDTDARDFAVRGLMMRSRAAALLLPLVVGSIALGACGSSAKTSSQTSSTGAAPGSSAPNVVVLGSATTEFTLTVAHASVTAGDVTFTVRNAGKLDHEMVVLKTDVAFDKLPIADAGDPPVAVATGANKVDEADNVGETGSPNLKPGQSRTFTIKNLAAGTYVLVCNLEGHYAGGMRAALTVS